MRLIHCADLHLDSKLHTNLDKRRAKKRRDELLQNFGRLAEYAAGNGVEAVLIAGDLFDRDTVSALARNTVLAVIGAHPDIRFYYLRGNHDVSDCLGGAGKDAAGMPENLSFAAGMPENLSNASGISEKLPNAVRKPGNPADAAGMPENLFLFGNRWKTYREGKDGRIAVTGIELTRENSAAAPASLRLDPACFNIVMLHGQEGGHTGRAGVISLSALRGRGIDYLALGHIHAYKKASLDSRGVYCYPGCLEGRGFDESGAHGFAVLDVDEKTGVMEHRFVPFAQRTLYALRTDVSGCLTTAQMKDLVDNTLCAAGCTGRDMVDMTLCGELDVDCEKDTGYLRTNLETAFFFARLRDETTLRIDIDDYLYDESLRGEFVRLVMADPAVPPEDKTAVIRCGFKAMDGEEPQYTR